MEDWSVHHLHKAAELKLGASEAAQIRIYAQQLIRKKMPVIFTLKHLSMIAGVDYLALRRTVERRREAANYRMFAIKKRSGGRRFIHSVTEPLHRTQQFINSEILQKIEPHPASFAFHSSGGVRRCAEVHCGARWIFSFDLADFFFKISEVKAYEIFHKVGYRPLLAFELARICTTTRLPKKLHYLLRNTDNAWCQNENWGKYQIYSRHAYSIGVLPQGAPTSPMLSNLAALKLDVALTEFADKYGFSYTRYADDLSISSCSDLPSSLSVARICRIVIGIIRKCGFEENQKKTRIAGPGAKKIVLGLLVDGPTPRISKETYKRIDRHLHAIQKYGFAEVAAHEKFDSPIGLYNHIHGLISFVKDVDPKRWDEFNCQLLAMPAP